MKTLYLVIAIGIIIVTIFGSIFLITPVNQIVTLSGDKAWQVCAALQIPCSSNPTFQATRTGFDTYVVIFHLNDKRYTVTIRGSTSSIVPSMINQSSNASSNVSTVIIPKGSSDPSSGKNYEPRYLLVVLGVNNTVRWINEDDMPNTIVTDTNNQPDPLFEKGPYSKGVIMSGKSFNFTFTKIGEYQYDTEPHPWLYGWVVVFPQSPENVTQTVVVNDTKIPGPCEIFALPCPNNPIFTAQKFGSDVYIEKVTVNGYDKYAIVHPSTSCVYPPSYNGNKTCRNPDDLAILRLVGVDTSIPQENLDIAINGLNSTYAMGDPVNFGIKVNGYGHCDSPSVLVIREGVIVWQGKTALVSCPSTMNPIDEKYVIGDLGGPFYLNQSGTYTVHVGYASNMTEKRFDVIRYSKTSVFDTGVTPMSVNVTNTNFTINYDVTGNGKILDAIMDMPSKSLVLSLEAPSNGTLTVTLPRAMIDAKLPTGNDDKYYVLVNGQESIFKEINATTIDRTISIPFTNETRVIEIIGAQII
ncbi:MAG: cupredoxin domain-containing protein [Nitrosotalea sp.]